MVLNVKIGSKAIDLVREFPRLNGNLSYLTFRVYSPTPGFMDRLASSQDPLLRSVAEKARRLRQVAGSELPYWESILSAATTTRSFDRVVQEALRHDSMSELSTRFKIAADKNLFRELRGRIDGLSGSQALALCSLCGVDSSTEGHIPMMDFRCSPSKRNLEKLTVAIRSMGQTCGAILESGKSYHYYGFQILSPKEWVQFMAKSLLLAPLVDTRYIAHRLQIGACVLRLTSSEQKPIAPRVVRLLK